jgi:hypothetical protein
MRNPEPADMAERLVAHCGDRDLARRTAERLTSEHFAMNPTDSRFWHEVAKVLRSTTVDPVMKVSR